MQKISLVVLACVILAGMTSPVDARKKGRNKIMDLTVASSAFKEGEPIPALHTCEGKNTSPALAWTGIPAGTKSLALICDDPDAPMGTWVHWVAWNIPPDKTGLPEAMASEKVFPDGTRQGVNSGHKTGFHGPCPPSGTHRYYFKVYALDAVLELKESADKAVLESAMKGHVLAQGQLMGRYKKKGL